MHGEKDDEVFERYLIHNANQVLNRDLEAFSSRRSNEIVLMIPHWTVLYQSSETKPAHGQQGVTINQVLIVLHVVTVCSQGQSQWLNQTELAYLLKVHQSRYERFMRFPVEFWMSTSLCARPNLSPHFHT